LLEPIFLAWTSYEKEIPYGKMGPYGFSQESWRCWIHKHKDNELMFALQMALQNREREREEIIHYVAIYLDKSTWEKKGSSTIRNMMDHNSGRG
jgi:hypothetical protein